MKLVVLLILLALSSTIFATNCGYGSWKACNTFKYLISANESIIWPTDEHSVLKLCTAITESNKCFHSYQTKCQDNKAEKDVFSKITSTLQSYNTQICTTAEQRKQFQDRIQCYTQPEVTQKLQNKWKRFILLLVKEPKHACCAALYLKHSIHQLNEKHCKPEVTEYVDSLAKRVFNTQFYAKCSQNQSYAECYANLPLESQNNFNFALSNPSNGLFRSYFFYDNDGEDTKLTGSWWYNGFYSIGRIGKFIWRLTEHHRFIYKLLRELYQYCNTDNNCS